MSKSPLLRMFPEEVKENSVSLSGCALLRGIMYQAASSSTSKPAVTVVVKG